MDNRLKNYSSQPDPEVWKQIQKTLRRQELRRQAIGGTIGTLIAVAAIVTVVLWPYDTKPTATQEAQPQLAQVAEAPVPTASAMEEVTETPAQPQVQPQPVAAPATSKPVKNEERLLSPSAPVVAETVPAVVGQQQAAAVADVRPAEAKSAVAVETPSTQQAMAAAQTETPSALKETSLSERTSATPAVKSQMSNAASGDTILWVPNAFAPNSDNPDITTFRVRLNKSDASILNYRITVFNRQGHQVYHSTDISQAWDGTYKGRALSQGGYVYVIYYVDKDGLTHQRKGTVALIR